MTAWEITRRWPQKTDRNLHPRKPDKARLQVAKIAEEILFELTRSNGATLKLSPETAGAAPEGLTGSRWKWKIGPCGFAPRIFSASKKLHRPMVDRKPSVLSARFEEGSNQAIIKRLGR